MAAEWQEYEVADALASEEPRREHIINALSKDKQRLYDQLVRNAYLKLLAKEYASAKMLQR